MLEGKQMIRECILRNNEGAAPGSSLVTRFGEWVGHQQVRGPSGCELQETDDPNGKIPDTSR